MAVLHKRFITVPNRILSLNYDLYVIIADFIMGDSFL